MTTPTKWIFSGVAVLSVMGALAFFGLTPFGKSVINNITSGSPTGSTFNQAKTAMINWAPTTAAATSTSLLNSDSSDRIIKQVQYSCTGFNANFMALTSAGVATVVFQAATSSTNAPAVLANTNYALNTQVATSSSVSEVWVGSTTPGATATVNNRRWAAGTYLTFTSNATSSAAACTIGVDYIAS